jgi:predicted nucleic acid-binding protein
MKNIYLIDTNIIVYAFNLSSEFHFECLKILENSLNGKLDAVIADKTLYEFYAVLTDERRVENPVSITEVKSIINILMNSKIEILYSNSDSLRRTLELTEKYGIRKQDVFDFVLVGIMLQNKIENIITLNDKHFKIIEEIKVTNPISKIYK